MKNIPLKAKVKLTSGQGNWHFFESEFVKGRQINVADGPHGVRVYGETVQDGDFLSKRYLKPATLFPSASAMASTWNPALIEEAGSTIGRECKHHQVDVLLGPGINLKRSPLGGRNFEYYSEDPYLTSKIGEHFVKGVQSQDVGACIKHFALNEQETMRRFVDVKINQRTLHEMYLYPFYKIIKTANPWMVMSSYNKINGDYASESSYLLQDVLRKDWGYDGVVVSDWGAVQDKVKSLKNGMNIEMPGPSSFEEETIKALENQSLTETELDASLEPLFDLHEKVKAIKQLQNIDLDAHHKIAKKVAQEAIVLLENDGVLPIKDTTKTYGMIGQFAKKPRINGGGSATVKPYHQETPFEAFSNALEHLIYADGYEENVTNETLLNEAVNVAKQSDIVFYFTGTTEAIETEGKDREHITLPEGHQTVFEAIRNANKNIIVILSNGSALDLRDIKQHSRAILETWFLGGAAGEAIIDIILGRISPSGRLQETFPLKLEHTPHFGTFPQLVEVDYNQDLILNGYRYYDTKDYPVLYPFGYGLSYSDIVYKDFSFKINASTPESFVTVTLSLENKSNISSFETVQVYIGSNIKHLIKPKKELKSFKKIWCEANQTTPVEINIPLDAFETYSETEAQFVVYNGAYDIYIGKNSRDIENINRIQITEQKPFAPKMTLEYPVKFLKLFYPDWYRYIEDNFRKLWWHESEEPIWRIIDRYKRHKNIDETTINTLLGKIKKTIEN